MRETAAPECPADCTSLQAVGVDGAPGGWLAVACFASRSDRGPAGRRTSLRFFRSITELAEWRATWAEAGARTPPIAIDIPIGLPDRVGFRDCDREARDRLGTRRDSVFQTPSRSLIPAALELHEGKPPKSTVIFARARDIVAAEQAALDKVAADEGATYAPAEPLRRISQQAAGILAKVAEVDAFMLKPRPGEPEPWSWMIEVHPEVCFLALNGDSSLPKKQTAHGQVQRLRLVRREFPDAEDRIAAWAGGAEHSLLDIMDAYAGCWSALRWAATGGGALDRRGDVDPPLRVLGEAEPGKPRADSYTRVPMRMVV